MIDSGTSEIGYRGAETIIRLTVHDELQLTWNELAMD